MAGVAQLVERWFVVPVVVGSNPVTRPIKFNPTEMVGFNFIGLMFFCNNA